MLSSAQGLEVIAMEVRFVGSDTGKTADNGDSLAGSGNMVAVRSIVNRRDGASKSMDAKGVLVSTDPISQCKRRGAESANISDDTKRDLFT